MFGWFKQKKLRDQEFMEGMMRAMAEGDSRAKVNRALGSMGIQFENEPDNIRYFITASSAIVRLIARTARLRTH